MMSLTGEEALDMAGGRFLDGFRVERRTVGEVSLRVRIGGSGPPLLLLDGDTGKNLMLGPVAGEPAEEFPIVAPDIRGYGDSSQPATVATHETYGKRAM